MKHTITIELAVLLTLAAASAPAADKLDLAKIDVAKLPPAADQQGVTYDANIRPLLQDSCVRCHGEDRPKAGLRLDSLAGVLKGGKDGKVVVPGDSKASWMVIAASRIDDDTAMPPKRRPGRGGPGGPGRGPDGGPGRPPEGQAPPPGGDAQPPRPNGAGGHGGFGGGGFGPPPKPLTAEQVGLVRAWIDQGAK